MPVTIQKTYQAKLGRNSHIIQFPNSNPQICVILRKRCLQFLDSMLVLKKNCYDVHYILNHCVCMFTFDQPDPLNKKNPTQIYKPQSENFFLQILENSEFSWQKALKLYEALLHC